MKVTSRPLPRLLLLLLLPIIAVSYPATGAEPVLEVSPPLVILDGVEAPLTVRASGGADGQRFAVRVVDERGRQVGRGVVPNGSEAEIPILVKSSGRLDLELVATGKQVAAVPFTVRSVPGWLSLAPPFLAILLALLFRQVVPALVAGVWLGAWIAYGNPGAALLRTVDRYVVEALSDPDHVSIIVFSLLLGGMVGVISRSGGTLGLVNALVGKATSAKRGQLVTWFLGIAVFFDDYANTLVVGNTMRPVTDRLRVSREKLAYIVDSTAAPVAAIGIISTWIGYEVSLIDDALDAVGSDLDAYGVFLQSIPYNFYPVLALAFGFLIAWSGRDFGPMLTAERRAAGGKLLRDGAVPLADFEGKAFAPVEGKPHRPVNAVAPVLTVLVVTFVAQWFTGRASLLADGNPLGSTPFFRLGFRGMLDVFTSGNSFHALLYASAAACLVAIALARAQKILTVGEALAAWIQGIKGMVTAFIILTLAWSIGQVCVDLHTSGYVVSALTDRLDPRILPALVFLFSAVIAFATGTSWATMGILVPLAVPAAFGVAQAAGYGAADAHRIFLGAVSAVLAGAIFGDHCSPISDTTVLSSMSSGCDHVDHVKTQLPYALVVAFIAMLLGYVPCAFGLSPWIGLLLGGVVLAAAVRFLGRRA